MNGHERYPDTRTKIRQVALKLFAEQGYEKTSLREIADRLNVTKAALYYHFKAKEEIITSLIDDMLADMDNIIVWANNQPRTLATRQEILQRYANSMKQRQELFRFFQENQSTLRDLRSWRDIKRRTENLSELLCEKTDSLEKQLKARLALLAVHACLMITQDVKASREERIAVALQVAQQLIENH